MKSLILLLRCPITGETVAPAPEELLRSVNAAQRAGTLRNRNCGLPEPFESGLVTGDGAWFYPIRSDIPVLLAGEAVGLPKGIPGE